MTLMESDQAAVDIKFRHVLARFLQAPMPLGMRRAFPFDHLSII
jgi:hypothetical protein